MALYSSVLVLLEKEKSDYCLQQNNITFFVKSYCNDDVQLFLNAVQSLRHSRARALLRSNLSK